MSEVPIELVKASPFQPRLTFNTEDIKSSITRDGIIVPLTVRKVGDHYELIDGERRFRVAKELQLKTVPITVAVVNDEQARRMVYKVNKERQNYTPYEEAVFFRKLVEKEGMKPYQIEMQLGVDHNWVMACLNVWKLPKDLQDNVFGLLDQASYRIYLSDVYSLETEFLRNVDDAVAVLRQIIAERMTADEKREFIGKSKKKINHATIEKALEKVSPEVKSPETPEELERVATVLKGEAKRKREETVTPEEKARRDAEKKRKAEEKRKKQEEKKKAEEEKLQKKLEVEKLRLEEEAKRRLEEERTRLEEESRAKAREELLKDKDFIREFRGKEHPLPVEDLKEQLMQKLSEDVPEEKRGRAKEIFEEGFNSLQKRIEIFPEKSAKIEPKFDQLRSLEERGVIPYTVWDFPYRDDYAGDKDFHGNCSPQVVEQCIWRLTEEEDLVVDPMAGSGTALDVCKNNKRRSIGYDVKPPENRPDIVQNDSSRQIPLEDKSVDMVFIHPPYWDLVHYTKAEENLPDLSRAKTPDQFIDMLERVFRECHRILKPKKFMCVLLGDLIRDGRFISLCRKATDMVEKLGFADYGYAVKLAHGEVSRKKSGVIVAEPIYTKNLKISHDLVMFFRKD